ncbi:MAG: hypothetical protein KDA83_18215, partial [Planctomycetales bacterium]|nr:hypothetical protein [Planctomycetales bacterium]
MKPSLAQRIAARLPGPMARWADGRVGRKFLRDKMALLASLVIGVYFALALFVVVGGISADACNEPIDAVKLPGFWQLPTPTVRRQLAEAALSRIDAAMADRDPEKRLQNLTINVRPFNTDLSMDRINELLDEGFPIYDELALAGDELETNPDLLVKLDELEGIVDQMLVPLSSKEQWERKWLLFLGTDTQGRSIFLRAIFSIKVAVQIGLVTAIVSTLIGACLGAAAGYFGGWIDHVVTWIYSTFS